MKRFQSFSMLVVLASFAVATDAAADLDHLQCFKIKDSAAKAAYTADLASGNPALQGLGAGCSIKVPAKLLCVDASTSNVNPSPPGSSVGSAGQEYLCYKATCPKSTVGVTARDRFGDRSLSATSTSLVCSPIDVRVDATDFTFVVSAIDLPASAPDVEATGFDLDGDGSVDNQFGSLAVFLDALTPGIALQSGIDAGIDRGETVTLVQVRATDLADATPARFATYVGNTDDVSPPACSGSSDTTCRRHLSGSGTFSVSESSPVGSGLAGRIVGGKFTGGPGTVNLQISLADTAITLPLHGTLAQVNDITDAGWSGAGSRIGGAIAQSDIDGLVVPALASRIRSVFDVDCTVSGTPPACGCPPGSEGEALRNLFDQSPSDCTISAPEIAAEFAPFLTPDIDTDGDGSNDAVSIGIGVHAVKGTFPAPH